MVCGASEMPWIRPVILHRKNPFGTIVKENCQHERRAATSSVAVCCLNTHCNVRAIEVDCTD